MKRFEIIKKIIDCGVIAIVRAESKEQGIKIIDAIKNGGMKILEVTMTVPNAVEIIKEVIDIYKNDDLIIGAGTVLDPETARICILAGAQFIVSPSLNSEAIKLCNRYGILAIPGAITPREVMEALEIGVELIKIFPANLFGPSIIITLKGPFPQGNFIPTGGVNIDNIKEWFSAGAVAVGIGSELTKGAKTGDYNLITETAKKFVEEIRKAKNL